MFSFNPINEKSLAIAIIHGKKRNNLIYLSNNTEKDENSYSDQEEQGFEEYELPYYNERFSIYPSTSEDVMDRIYIAGPSGSGKTTIIRDYVREFIKEFPRKSIYLFSNLKEDEKLDDLKKIKRVKIDEDLVNEPIEPSDLKDSLLLFDDIDSIKDKSIKTEVQKIRDSCLTEGRHHNIMHIMMTNHRITDHNNTKDILNESSHVIFFPTAGLGNVNYLLKTYLGLETNQIKLVKKLKSRWVCIRALYPRLLISENQIMMLSKLE
jgi:GTPase SAR1 family protein